MRSIMWPHYAALVLLSFNADWRFMAVYLLGALIEAIVFFAEGGEDNLKKG